MIGYAVELGSLQFAGEGREARRLLAIETDVGIGGTGGRCRLELGDPSWGAPSLGDAITIELDTGKGGVKVFTGEVECVDRRATTLWVHGRDGLAKLALTEVEEVFEESSVGEIVKALVAKAGATPGELEAGPSLPSYVVHRGPRALRHAQKLASLIGAELASDAEGKVHMRAPSEKGSPAHQLAWGKDLISLSLAHTAAPIDSFLVWGEGAAASQGVEKSHWLPTDLSGVTGKAKLEPGPDGEPGKVASGSEGPQVRTVFEGAVRTAAVAEQLAGARALQIALRPVLGHVLVLGRPELRAGEWVELAELPGDAASTSLTLRVLRVIHQFTCERGLLTRLEF